jgi:hypothetical protein
MEDKAEKTRDRYFSIETHLLILQLHDLIEKYIKSSHETQGHHTFFPYHVAIVALTRMAAVTAFDSIDNDDEDREKIIEDFKDVAIKSINLGIDFLKDVRWENER